MRLSNNIFDQGIFFLIMFLAVLPFGHVYHLRLPGITLNAFELIWLLMFLTFLLKMAFEKKLKKQFVIVGSLFIAVTIMHLVASAAIYDSTIKAAVVHFRNYLPFLGALVVFAVGTSFSMDKWLKGFVVAAGLSSFAALFLHHYVPNFVRDSYSASEEVQDVMLAGRLVWSNASLAFFALIAVYCKEVKIERWVIFLAVIFSFLAMLNTLNRTMLIGYSMFIILTLFVTTNFQIVFRRMLTLFVITCSSLGLVMMLSYFDKRVASLIELRFFGRGDLATVYENSVVLGRMILYEKYAQSIIQHFPFGQGLGNPFVLIGGKASYTSDISIISFLLPFGVIGLLIFGIFVFKVFSAISQSRWQISNQTMRLLFLFFGVFLLMSLNIDFFSRNNFVIYLAALVVSLRVPLRNSGWIHVS